MIRLPRAVSHLLAAIVFLAFAVLWTWPLLLEAGTSIPGEPGDNLDFLWNMWWMREAIASPQLDFFRTDRLFAPFGVDLTLHTHTALPAWIGATVLAPLSTIAAQNAVIVGSLALNGFAAYLLAWRETRHAGASLVGGVMFASSAYIASHLLGHYNLIAPWGIPLFVLFLLAAIERRSRLAALAAGIVLALTAYVDYYYVVYEAVIAGGLVLAGTSDTRDAAIGGDDVAVSVRTQIVVGTGGGPSWWRRLLMVLLVVDLALVMAVVVSGGFDTTLAGIRIRAARPTNLLSVGWLLLALWATARWPPRIGWWVPRRKALGERMRVLWPAAVAALAGLTPLIVRGWALWRAGDYTAPRGSWRSGPAGVDLATVLLGHSRNTWTGGWTRALYQRFAIDPIEGSAWVGLAALLLVVWSLRDWRSVPRRWIVIAAVFFVWALGGWLHVAGVNTGLLLPQNVFQFVPILSNARIPGRAMAVVMLAVSVIAAFALSRVPSRWRLAAVAGAFTLTLADAFIAPFPLTRIEAPRFYETLRGLPPGVVCELPGGFRDGLGSVGRFDDRVASFQMTHGHPIVGGFLARVPESIKRRYAEQPVVRSLFRLSADQPIDPRDESLDRAAVGAALGQAGIRYVVLNRETAPAGLVDFTTTRMPLRMIEKDGVRELYELEP